MNIFNDYTILHRSPPQSASSRNAGWTEGAADILGGRPRETAPAEPLGQGQCVEVRREDRMKVARTARRRRRPHKGRPWPHGGGEGCTKAARPARRRRGPHKCAEGRTRGGNGRTEAARAAQRRRGPQEGDEGRTKALRLHEGRQRPHRGSKDCTKAARPARRQRGPAQRRRRMHEGRQRPHGGGEGRMKAARAA